MNRDVCAINFTGLTHDHTAVHSNVRPPICESGHENLNEQSNQAAPSNEFCSAISILKRHPMYDCLVLVKKFRHCLNGYSLEFPVDRIREDERIPTNESAKHQHSQGDSLQPTDDGRQHNDDGSKSSDTTTTSNGNHFALGGQLEASKSACSQQRLVSRFLDGDDPIYSCCAGADQAGAGTRASQSPIGSDTWVPADNQENHDDNHDDHHQENKDGSMASCQMVEVRGSRIPIMVQIDDKGHRCDLVHVPVNGLLDRLENYTRQGVAVDGRVYAFAMGLKTAERMITTKSMKELQETPI